MVSIVIPLLVAVVGALIYAFAEGKLSEVGHVLLLVGAFWTVYLLTGSRFSLPH